MIIDSLLDTDFYKITMQQAVLHQFPSVQVEYEFKCRNDIKWTDYMVSRIRYEAEYFSKLRFKQDELDYLAGINYIKKDYIDFLKLYQPDLSHISINLVNGELKINIKGPWFLTIYWEVPLLAIISEVYSLCNDRFYFEAGKERLDKKLEWFGENPFQLSDFGTRRRYSASLHDYCVSKLSKYKSFVGTSNVYLARKYNVKVVGTQAHEWCQAHQVLFPLPDFQKEALNSWVKEYGTDLGIALTDTIGINSFLKDFSPYFATVYSGLRQDSGDPEVWADKVLAHYDKLGIDARTKTLVFSDGLDFCKAKQLSYKYCLYIKCLFGIGTNITNDTGLTPPNIVIKMTKCNGQPVAKISDSPGKSMCEDAEYLNYLRKVFDVK